MHAFLSGDQSSSRKSDRSARRPHARVQGRSLRLRPEPHRERRPAERAACARPLAPRARAVTQQGESHRSAPVLGPGGGAARAWREGRTRRGGGSGAAGTGGSSLARTAASTRGAKRHMAAPHAQTAAPRPKRAPPGRRVRASELRLRSAGAAPASKDHHGQRPRAVAGAGRQLCTEVTTGRSEAWPSPVTWSHETRRERTWPAPGPRWPLRVQLVRTA